eukprot:TRINITY_DN1786_c0_g1_i1.p1 TRINITY_DN1786_c0_g1~~TRINITY_DN1786_c0_g1_i1.p1  ORF type:complete len:323 (-),score=47.12 TRINITY_DN1786_c0_g1_i1:2631-3551(-)
MKQSNLNMVVGKRVYVTPNIPEQKLMNAVNSYGQGIAPESVWILVDDTVFGGARQGIMITEDTIYCKELNCNPKKYRLYETKEVSYEKKSFYVDFRKIYKPVVAEAPDIIRVIEFVKGMLESRHQTNTNSAENDSIVQLNKSANSEFAKQEKSTSTMEETPTRTKERNEYMSIRHKLKESEKKKRNPSRITYTIVAIIVSGLIGLGMADEITGFWAKTLIVVVSLIAGTPCGILGGIIGGFIGNIARPDMIFTTGGAYEILKAKIFWAVGPQLIGVAIGALIGVMSSGGILANHVFKAQTQRKQIK